MKCQAVVVDVALGSGFELRHESDQVVEELLLESLYSCSELQYRTIG